jgi:hypothetical protein
MVATLVKKMAGKAGNETKSSTTPPRLVHAVTNITIGGLI